MWSGAMATPAPPALTARDHRPLRDRPFQAEMRKEIAAWLTETGWTCSAQTLNNITAKDFKLLFQHLVVLLDPNYPFDPNARLEDDFVPALKCMQYPFVNQLDPKWLVTPASMHAWPSLLGVLHWLVEQGKVCYRSISFQHQMLPRMTDLHWDRQFKAVLRTEVRRVLTQAMPCGRYLSPARQYAAGILRLASHLFSSTDSMYPRVGNIAYYAYVALVLFSHIDTQRSFDFITWKVNIRLCRIR
jgi:hypothetical protein